MKSHGAVGNLQNRTYFAAAHLTADTEGDANTLWGGKFHERVEHFDPR